MNEKLTEKVSFEFIRYANCWEDAELLLEGFALQPGEKVLSVASAGDNSFLLLVQDPGLVVAIDVNKIQLYLVELKKVCIENFDREEVIAFLGFKPSTEREKHFDLIKNKLSVAALEYWSSNMQMIREGLVNKGKFEKYFITFAGKILPFIHRKNRTAELFRTKSDTEQKTFYDQKWNSWRWRMLFRIFFSKRIMGKYGRDPEFLREVKFSVSDYILGKAGRHLQTKAAQDNFMLRFQLTGSFGDLLPPYLSVKYFEKIKANIGKLKIREGYAQDAMIEFGKFDAMNLSNIFEYMDKELFERTAHQLIEGSNPGARLAYWNLMVPRRISGVFQAEMKYRKESSKELTDRDRGFFYNQFIIDEKL